MICVNCDKISLSLGIKEVLKDISFTIQEGDKVGIVGVNGAGKSTLFKIIAGLSEPDSGSVFTAKGYSIGYLAQNGGYDSANTVFEEMREIFAADIHAIATLRETEEKISCCAEGSNEYRALSQKYESLNRQIAARDSYHYEVKIRTVLNGMGFENNYEQPICTMSGGEKTRLKLCRLLLEEPELLILDEPTNHLDMKTLFWLEEYLAAFKGAILTVSHDRYFLDKLVSHIVQSIDNNAMLVRIESYDSLFDFHFIVPPVWSLQICSAQVTLTFVCR